MDRYCPACGKPLVERELDGARRQTCVSCGRVHYRNSKPAVGAAIVRGGRVLLSKRARPPHAGEWDLPGGFLEWGEDPEAGLLREVREETGLEARALRLLGAWVGRYASDATLNLVYEVEAEGDPTASSESAALEWFDLKAVPPLAFPHEREALRRL